MSKLYNILNSMITRLKKAETLPDLSQNDPTQPDYVKGKEEVILRPQISAVGQALVVKTVDENGKPTEWGTSDVGSVGGSSVQSDLSQNDETAADFVKGRTHYCEVELRSGSGASTTSTTDNNYYVFTDDSGVRLYSPTSHIGFRLYCANEWYTERDMSVLHNVGYTDNMDVRIKLKSFTVYEDRYTGYKYKFVGNHSLLATAGISEMYADFSYANRVEDFEGDFDSGEPWCIIFEEKNGYLYLRACVCRIEGTDYWCHGEMELDIKRYYEYTTYYPLADEYIPDSIQRIGDDIIIHSSTEGSTKTFRLVVDDNGTITAEEW